MHKTASILLAFLFGVSSAPSLPAAAAPNQVGTLAARAPILIPPPDPELKAAFDAADRS